MRSTDTVLRFIEQTEWNDLPSEVQHQSKRCLLDLIGALVAGTATPVARLMADFVAESYAGHEATVLTGAQRSSAVGAALANGFAANALDIDDGYRRIKGHPGACVLPALLAAVERCGAVPGKDFLAALVVGYEVGIRAGLIRHALYSTYHSSGSWGAIAAAAAAGKVLGLKGDVLRQALGTAEYHAPIAPMMKGITTPSMGKDSIGWGTMVGLASVLMAEKGFTGVEPLFSDTPRSELVVRLGEQYEIMNLYFKPYACCRWAQPAVAGSLEIARGHNLLMDDIQEIRVYTFQAASELSREHPQSTEDAQYNMAFPVAAALMDGQLGPQQVLPPRIYDPALLALADRVRVTVRPEYEAAFPDKAYADVEILTRDGSVLHTGRKEAIWEPPDTLPTDDELQQKFSWLASPVLGQARAAAVLDMVWSLEHVDDVGALIKLCASA